MELLPVYCISGLGADRRIFEHLSLPGCAVTYLDWLQPERKEALAHYAERMLKGVRHERPILLGLSFGGMMAVEMARLVPVRRLWLLSTVKQRSEMPFYMRFGKHLPLHRLAMPLKPYRWLGPIESYNLGVETAEERAIVAQYRRVVNPTYIDWAIDAIVNWDMPGPPGNSFHIHGSRDHIFPVALARPDRVVPGGGHMMVHNRATEVSLLLHEDAQALQS